MNKRIKGGLLYSVIFVLSWIIMAYFGWLQFREGKNSIDIFCWIIGILAIVGFCFGLIENEIKSFTVKILFGNGNSKIRNYCIVIGLIIIFAVVIATSFYSMDYRPRKQKFIKYVAQSIFNQDDFEYNELKYSTYRIKEDPWCSYHRWVIKVNEKELSIIQNYRALTFNIYLEKDSVIRFEMPVE